MSKFDKHVIGLEIFSIGTHTDSEGLTNDFTAEDMDHIIDVFGKGRPDFVPVKLGHTSDEFNRRVAQELGLPPAVLNGENEGLDGVAALGQVIKIYQDGSKLVADLNVPDAMAQLFADGYFRDVSCELSLDSEDRWILDGLAMLGAERPAVGDLAGIAEAAVLKKRPAFVGRTFSQKIPKKVKMSESEDKGKFQQILDRFKSSDETLSFSELTDAGLKLGEDADKGAVKDAIRELQDRSSVLDDVVALLQQAIELTSSAAEDGEEIVEDEVAAMPAVAAKELNDRLTKILSSKSEFKSNADFKSAVATQVTKATSELTTKVESLMKGQTASGYRVETEKLVGMEGKPEDLATQLADLEKTAGKETAEMLLGSWKKVSEFAVKAGVTNSIGSGDGDGGNEPEMSELEIEAADYRKDNPNVSEKEAQRFVNLRKMSAVRKKSGGSD